MKRNESKSGVRSQKNRCLLTTVVGTTASVAVEGGCWEQEMN